MMDQRSDRAANLESLAEEDDETVHNESIDDEDPKHGKYNQFDNLCDGVINNLALVHSSTEELLDLKDELVKHALPPNVLAKLAIVTTRVFRSISDMHTPVNELVRLVRLYSTPWEEKSTALKKLHEDFESKKTQLNIALKRLEMIDSQAKKIQREKLVMNWERVFAKLTAAKGHGRRWKFLIEAFKRKASLGMEHLHDYLEEFDESSEDEEDENEQTQMQQIPMSPSENESHKEDIEHLNSSDSSSDEENDEEDDNESKAMKSDIVVETHSNELQKTSMDDKECWTNEPVYDRFLNIRVYTPKGLEYNELRCIVNCGKETYKTDILDKVSESIEGAENKEEDFETKNKPEPPPAKKPLHGRGLIGNKANKEELPPEPKVVEESLRENIHYEQCQFYFPDEEGIRSQDKVSIAENIRISVHFGPRGEMVAMATLNIDDLNSLDLPVVYLPAPVGDEFIQTETLDENPPKITSNDENHIIEHELKDLSSVGFPLYPLHVGRGEAANQPTGSLPLLCFWTKRLKPTTLDKFTESLSITDIILEETGFDMTLMTKDDLHREVREEATSVMSVTPEPQQTREETVPKVEYDRIRASSQEQMQRISQEYEEKLKAFSDALNQMEENQVTLKEQMKKQNIQSYDHSHEYRRENRIDKSRSPSPYSNRASPTHFTSSSGVQMAQPVVIPDRHVSMIESNNKQFRVKPQVRKVQLYGHNVPKDFLDRLQYFEDEAERKKSKLKETLEQETREMIERKLASQYRISDKGFHESIDPLLDVSLPAVFMPNKSTNMMIYNPRANKYFHPSGSVGTRLTQPPSMLQLPPLNKDKVSVLNLFDISQNFSRDEPDWLMQQYIRQNTTADSERKHSAILVNSNTPTKEKKTETLTDQAVPSSIAPESNLSYVKSTQQRPMSSKS